MNLGENIYNNRIRCRLSQGDLADTLDVSRQSISKWENNAAVPELDKLVRLCSIFDITLDELVFARSNDETNTAPQSVQTITMVQPRPDLTSMKRTAIGLILLAVGLLSFLLAAFWGPQLRIGEELGEMLSLCMVFASAILLAPHNFKVFSMFAVGVFLYLVASFGLLEIHTYNNMFFIIALGLLVWIWFFVLLAHANKETEKDVKNDCPLGTAD